MTYLLDTQLLLWILFDSKRLNQSELKILNDESNEIVCSSISIFEISLKYSIGKLELFHTTPDKIPEALQSAGYQMKEVGLEVYSTFYRLPVDIHKDPFDRLLIWEAIQNNYTLLTRDREIEKYQKYGLKVR